MTIEIVPLRIIGRFKKKKFKKKKKNSTQYPIECRSTVIMVKFNYNELFHGTYNTILFHNMYYNEQCLLHTNCHTQFYTHPQK